MAYTTIALVKNYLGIDDSVTAEDTALTAAVNAAEDLVDGYTGTTFNTITEARTYIPFSRYVVNVDQFNTTAGLVVKLDSSNDGTFDTTLDAGDYQVEPLNAGPYYKLRRLNGVFPVFTNDRATVQVTAAYGVRGTEGVPYGVQQAALILAARLFQRKASPLGYEAGWADWGPMRISRTDPDVSALLQQYKKIGVA